MERHDDIKNKKVFKAETSNFSEKVTNSYLGNEMADNDDSFFSCAGKDDLPDNTGADVNDKCLDMQEQGDNVVEVKQLRQPTTNENERDNVEVKQLRRATSSPALGAISRRRSLGESGRLSDVSQLLFSSSSNNIGLERPATAQAAVKQQPSSQTEIKTNASKIDAKPDEPPPPPPPMRVKTQAQVVGDKMRPSLPPKGDTKGSKDNKSTLSPKRNTGGSKSKDKTVMAKANSPKRDLLSRFKTYEDQLRVDPANRYNQLPQHSPKSQRTASRRQRTSGSSGRRTTQSTLSSEAREDGVQMCSIQASSVNENESTPESQKQAGLLKKKGGVCPSSPSVRRSNYPRSIIPLVFDILRIAVVSKETFFVVYYKSTSNLLLVHVQKLISSLLSSSYF